MTEESELFHSADLLLTCLREPELIQAKEQRPGIHWDLLTSTTFHKRSKEARQITEVGLNPMLYIMRWRHHIAGSQHLPTTLVIGYRNANFA